MANIKQTKYVKLLNDELLYRGLRTKLEYWDGHKHIDIAILDAKIFIEVDGLQHFTSSRQIISDFKRNHYSDDDNIDTIHIPNIVIEYYGDKVADAISSVAKKRIIKK